MYSNIQVEHSYIKIKIDQMVYLWFRGEPQKISMQVPYYVLFLTQGIHVHLKNLLDMQLHSAYIQHNLRYAVLKQFAQLYIHPKVPFQAHQSDKHVHIVYIRYMYRKFLLRVT